MIYIVSGFMRTGTSMMMQSLEAGGLEAVYSERRDAEMNARWGDDIYLPNTKYYELDAEDYRTKDILKKCGGKLVKMLWGGAIALPVGEYRLIFMRRPVEEIRASLIAFFGEDTAVRNLIDLDKRMDQTVEILRDRKSFLTVDVVQYHDVLNNPLSVFKSLNWPIDPAAAARIPVKKNARYLLERAEEV